MPMGECLKTTRTRAADLGLKANELVTEAYMQCVGTSQ